MSKQGNGIDNNGFSSVLGEGFTIYQGSPNFSQSSRYRPSGQGQDGFGVDTSSNYDYISDQNNIKSPNQRYQPSKSEKVPEKDEATTDPNDTGIVHLLNVYADKCSLNGVIFIKSSKYMVVKAIWSVLLLVAISFMLVHLYMLGSTYYSYEKQSKVDLKFENLKFPAVTFCNVNAMRYSEMHLASNDLQQLIHDVSPDKMYDDVDYWEPTYEEEVYHFNEFGEYDTWGNDYAGSGDAAYTSGDYYDSSWFRRRRKKRSTDEYYDDDTDSTTNITVRSRTNSFFDDYNYNWTNYDNVWNLEYSGDAYSGSWESESEPSAFEQIANQFISLYNRENGTTRQKMGHKIQDMLIQCAFVGRKCVQSNFTMVASSTMGNCYTIQYNKFIARKSGPREGLTLMLNLETSEYVPGITNAGGAKLVVHEPGTVPFPDDEGMAIGAGMETSIGLRRTSITRLDKPYGDCTDTNDFRKKYGIKYTRQACQEICEMETISNNCGCYDAVKPFIYTLLKDRVDLKTCQAAENSNYCMEDVKWVFQSNATCHCSSPCSEVTYKKTISSKPWPSTAFAKLMAKSVCKEKPDNPLCLYSLMDENSLSKNFVKINVYFETLNYESVSEEAGYSEFQFVSDIGGTVGLYIGISALSAFELLHLLISILRYIVCGGGKKGN